MHFKYERLPSLCFWCGCLGHEDRDCELWVESEGSLLPESQQFGPWLKAAPFVPSRKYVVKVPGIFNAKKADATTAKPRIAKQTPVVVVQSGKLAPEIVRSENIFTTPESILLEKDGFDVHKAENKEPDLQEANIQDTRQSTMEGKKEDVTIQHVGSAKEMVSGRTFEDVLGEIDKEIGKYDFRSVGATGSEVSMGKENLVGHPNIKEALLPCTQSRPAHLSFSPRLPLADIPNSLVSHGSVEGTWKRIPRIGLVADACMSEAVGGKRRLGSDSNQTELPKKRRVLQGGVTKNKILTEADNQPCQKQ